MTPREANIGLAAILSTLAETSSAPEGHMYAAMMSRYDVYAFQRLLAILAAGKLITRAGHVATITDSGRTMVANINTTLKGE